MGVGRGSRLREVWGRRACSGRVAHVMYSRACVLQHSHSAPKTLCIHTIARMRELVPRLSGVPPVSPPLRESMDVHSLLSSPRTPSIYMHTGRPASIFKTSCSFVFHGTDTGHKALCPVSKCAHTFDCSLSGLFRRVDAIVGNWDRYSRRHVHCRP